MCHPIRVDTLTAENVTIVQINGMNGKRFKVRSAMGHFCDISKIFVETIVKMKFIIIMLECKNSE